MTTAEYVSHIGVSDDLWSYLKRANCPVVLYGMGNGADKIIDVLRSHNIPIADIFASDEFVRGQSFHGKSVVTFSTAKEKYGDSMIALTSFGSNLDSVISLIYSIAEQCEMYIPDVPVCDGAIFDMEFFTKNLVDIAEARELLYDDISKKLYDNIIRYKLTGRPDYLKSASTDENTTKIPQTEKYRTIADLGAYNGDTIKHYAQIFPNLTSVIAAEPDIRSFKKLAQYAAETSHLAIECYNKAISNTTETVEFAASGNKGSNLSDSRKTTKTHTIETDTLDNLAHGRRVDFIKYDVEGAESPALQGSRTTIVASNPDLAVSLYHRSEDIFALIKQTRALTPQHRLYLRRKMCIPAWEIMLYAIK